MNAIISEKFLTEDEVCSILKIKKSTLNHRRYTGTEHPPYHEIGRNRLYPKDMFIEWINKRPVISEVRRVH